MWVGLSPKARNNVDRGAKVTQRYNISHLCTISPDYLLQHVQAGSTLGCVTCQRGGSMTEALNIRKKRVGAKDAKD